MFARQVRQFRYGSDFDLQQVRSGLDNIQIGDVTDGLDALKTIKSQEEKS